MISQHCVTFGENLNFSFDRIDQALAKIGSAAASMVLKYGTWDLDSNITIPSNVYFSIPPGAVLGGAFTLTIQGPFSGYGGCFGSALTVIFASGSVDEVLPKWFGETYLSLTRTRASIAVSGIPMYLGKIAADPTTTGWGAPETGTRWYNSAANLWKWWNGSAIEYGVGNDHSTLHENGGADEISVAGLSGTLADAQTPAAHKTSHENGGADKISVAGLSGALADAQTPAAHKASHESGGGDVISSLGSLTVTGGNIQLTTAQRKLIFDHALRYIQGVQTGGADYLTIAEHSFSLGIQLGFADAANSPDYPFYPTMTITAASGASGKVGIGTTTPRALLELNGDLITKGPWVDVRAYGATTSSGDNSAAIQAAVNANPGKAILIPEIYQIASSIVPTAATAVRLFGLGRSVSGLYSEADISLLKFDTGAGHIYYAEVSELYLASGNSGTRTSSFGIELTGANNVYRSSFHNLHSRGNYCGFRLRDNQHDWLVIKDVLFDNYGGNSHLWGIYSTSGGQAVFSGLVVFSSVTGIYMHAPFGDFTITGCNFDGGSYGIYLDGIDGVYSSNFNITGNKFDMETVNNVYLSRCQSWQVLGNSYSGVAIPAVYPVNCIDGLYDNWNGIPLGLPIHLGH